MDSTLSGAWVLGISSSSTVPRSIIDDVMAKPCQKKVFPITLVPYLESVPFSWSPPTQINPSVLRPSALRTYSSLYVRHRSAHLDPLDSSDAQRSFLILEILDKLSFFFFSFFFSFSVSFFFFGYSELIWHLNYF